MLPFLTALVYLQTASMIRGFSAAAVLNGFVFVLILTIPIAILAMRLAEKALKKPAASFR